MLAQTLIKVPSTLKCSSLTSPLRRAMHAIMPRKRGATRCSSSRCRFLLKME